MSSNAPAYQVGIVGGGPVGLYLACCLQRAGISCIVFEKRAHPVRHSRSIGIHPVALNIFEKTGLAEIFISAGIKVHRGRAFCSRQQVGTIDFTSLPPPFSFILTLPQYKTERILRKYLNGLNGKALYVNCRVTGISSLREGVEITFEEDRNRNRMNVGYLVGCDGVDSLVRRQAGIPFRGKTYDDTYIMGDFSRNTSLGNDAAIFLCAKGVIESFPLSKTLRRWVVKTNKYMPRVNRSQLEKRLARRIGHDLTSTENTMLSGFEVQKKRADTMALNRVLLAGDAAHIVSPIGGQGMNLGWLDVWDLSHCLQRIFHTDANPRRLLASYSRRRRKIAQKAIRRSEFNMWMGRQTNYMCIRKALLAVALKPPISHYMARLFTMHGLKSGIL